ncbi:asparagine synthetase B family protein [Rhodohalobacter sp. SW132]|uniref:asparagine synthase-related protein n=1 Tax=Rhodohalobacter sp. SW132 TaxID=2293433 RepID=UPI000E25A025|nr:asparagine synthase-related protein [Rhodohalobacter sp. SW132]REL37850.1 asparagine synthetase B family protein [Rhodohalobacter sp. SW132]
MPHIAKKLDDFVSLIDPAENQIFNMSAEEAERVIASGDPEKIREIEGSFAIVQKVGQQVFLSRSIGRPMRYFMAKQVSGPLLIVAERIDEIYNYLKELGFADQFRPDYTRMVPAHYLVRLDVIGCPDPNPQFNRYFTPERNTMNADLDQIGKTYIEALRNECRKWLETVPEDEPIGVLFSGGIDSGSVFLTLYHQMLEMGLSPSRLKAFTLSVGQAADADQAFDFLNQLGVSMFLEVIEADKSELDYKETIRVIEDYKLRDVEAATMTLTLCKKIREKYPNWTWLADGDGGDENMKSYPIEDNPELTIRSVLNNPLLYHEGWGVDKIKHSLTYSGGQSRGHIRTYAPAKKHGFKGFSPYSLPNVIEVSEGIPFIQLTDWSHEELYALKGDIVQRGVKAVTGHDMPAFPKRRFQHGAIDEQGYSELFPENEMEYRNYFRSLYA